MNRSLAALPLLALACAPAYAQTTPPVRILLFGDATYTATELDTDEGFALGQLVGHMNAALGPRLFVTTEATITPRNTGTVATLERLIVRYDFADVLKLSAGRYHTPIAWWNTQYHHGMWLQTTVDRPNLVRFGTPLVPVHFLGILAEGAIPVGAATVIYEAGVGNGRQPELVDPGDRGEADAAAAFVGGLRLRPGVIQGLELGIHGYLDEVPRPGGPVDERIVGGHAVLTSNPEIIAEYLHFRHEPDDAGAEATSSDGGYIQVGWRLPGVAAVLPYVRYENVDIGADDPLFDGLGLDYEGIIGGVRWDLASYAALKGEVRSERVAGAERAISFLLNVAFVVPNLIEQEP